MLGFMDYVQGAFYEATQWNRDNSYGSLTDTARALLEFQTPHGLRLNVSSLSSPNFATSYTLGSVGLVDGSLSYLYSSLPLTKAFKSSLIPLRALVPGYRHLQNLRRPDEPWLWEIWQQGKRVDKRDALLYGRLYLPNSTLEALYLRRLTPRSQLKISCVSDPRLPNGGSILALLQHDAARYSTECIYSTDGSLLGLRGLYNFGPSPSPPSYPPLVLPPPPITPGQLHPQPQAEKRSSHGLFSAGAELYYSPINKSSGVSCGLRFATLPAHAGFPYTMTLTLNPLMGNLSSTYSVVASQALTLSSCFDFNFYSYESELKLGLELWRRKRPSSSSSSSSSPTPTSSPPLLALPEKDMSAIKNNTNPNPNPPPPHPPLPPPPPPPSLSQLSLAKAYPPLASAQSQENPPTPHPEENRVSDIDTSGVSGVLKAKITHRGALALLWEARAKHLLYSCGVGIDARRGEGMLRSVGVEVSYSS